MNIRRYIGLFLSLFIISIGMVISTGFYPINGIEAESVAIHLDSERDLMSRIYIPKNSPVPYPVMFLCHGVNASKAVMEPLAVELARHGIAAIAFDFGGFGESYPINSNNKSMEKLEASTIEDARAILAFVRSHPDRFDVEHIGIIGHSLGGTTALQLAQIEPQLQSAIVLSMSGFATPTTPANLLLGVGLYEQLNPPKDLRQMLQQATNGCAHPGSICGDFSNNTARQLVISDTADHFTAPYDSQLMREVVNWAQKSLGVPFNDLPIVTPYFIIGICLTFIGGIASGVCLFLRAGKPVTVPKLRQVFRYFVSWLMGITIAVLWGMGSNGIAPSRGASNMLLFSYILQVCSNYALCYPQTVARAVRIASLYSLLCLGAFLLSGLLSGSGEILSKPTYLISLPKFIVQWIFFLFYNYSQALKLILFPVHTLALAPSLLFWMLVLLELIFPGVTLTRIEQVGVWSVTKLRNPWQLTGIGKISRKSASLLGGLLLLLGIILYQRGSDLSLVGGKGLVALQVFGLLLFLPLIAIVIIVRLPGFRRLENWLLVL
ncbi:alpha/beta hydrolase [Limnofasciculus baicalensis]|uniref:Alpha/beta hydrolase n=1 Tax=Limnofasciculus baicalensis BBK-W-15 TaxID=2699891 RepID=A0AAE3GWG6_9CYAN|nr:alpha/beta fold hydrolase [Limnofasciculus baicalensis]MCP2731724.1 alpha/beta hydrolase [Limnofasciculus baicalensis BBK-W-15]